jgi:hypothetical protein
MDAARFKLSSETNLTYQLKWAAWEWLYNVAGCRCIGFEVRLHGPWGRIVDVVGVGPQNLVYAVEVKSNRADFSRDDHTAADIAKLQPRTQSLHRRITLAEQTLAQASDFARCHGERWQDVRAYNAAQADKTRLQQELQRLEERIKTASDKFHNQQFLAAAHFHYIMAPPGVVLTEMLPPGWGLLDPVPNQIVAAPRKSVRQNSGIMANIFRAISRSNSASMMRAYNVRFGQEGAEFPKAPTQAPIATPTSPRRA